MSYAWLGPVAEMRQVPCPQSGVAVGVERASTSMQLLSGARYEQVNRRRHKTWDWSYVWDDPADLAWLSELASGGVVGPYWLYTSKAARENLAPPSLQVAGSGRVAGRRVLASGDFEVGQSRQIPILPDKAYMLSFLSNGSGSVTRRVFNAAGTQLSSVAVPAGASGFRVTDSFTTPATAAYMTLTLTAGVGQLRLTEGSHEGFMPGDGVAPVIVQDPSETLQRVIDGDHRSDFGVTLTEIG